MIQKVVPFRVVSVDIHPEDLFRQRRPSIAVAADGSKARIALLLECVMFLAAGSVTFRVVDLVDVPIGTTGPARISDGPGNVRNFLMLRPDFPNVRQFR